MYMARSIKIRPIRCKQKICVTRHFCRQTPFWVAWDTAGQAFFAGTLYFFSSPASRAYFRDKNWQQDLDKSCKQEVGLWAGEKYFMQWVSFASAPHQLHLFQIMTGPLLPSPLRRKSVTAFLFSFIYLSFKFNFLVHHKRNNNLTKMCEAKTRFNERCCWSKD